jgi:DNA-binding transcriptional regulator YiaG
MIHAYDEIYMPLARKNLASMLDYAVHDLNFNIADFFDLFLSSEYSKRFELGDFTVLAGMSGYELTIRVIEEYENLYMYPEPSGTIDRSEEYWLGYYLAYYQWYTGKRFKDIIRYVSIDELILLYSPYHEMDVMHFVDKVNEIINERKDTSNIKRIRISRGITQKELGELCEIPTRTIQRYEQRQKDINKASAFTLYILSKILCCEIIDLLEI